jgi:hypothetical protein
VERVAHGNFLKKRRYGGASGDPTALKKRVERPPNGNSCGELDDTPGLAGTPLTPHADTESSSEESWTFRRIRQRSKSPRMSQKAGQRPPFRALVSDSYGSSDDEAAILPLGEPSTVTLENVRRKRADASGRQPSRGSSDSNSVVIDATCLIQRRQEQLNERNSDEPLEPETTSIRIRDTSGEEQLQRSIIDLDAIVRMNEDTLRFRGLSHEVSGLKRGSRASRQAQRTAENLLNEREARGACDGFGGETDESAASEEDGDLE